MLHLIYRLIIQRVQEYKTKRSAIKNRLAKKSRPKSGFLRSHWIAIGAVLSVFLIAAIFAFRWQFSLPILKVNQDSALLEIRVSSLIPETLVLYLERWPPPLSPVPENDAISRIEIRNNQFIPSFQLVEPGSTIEIVNKDLILHNAHIDDGHNTVFNVATPLTGVAVQKTLTATGILNVRCDLHPGMHSWVFVPPSPHFAIVHDPAKIKWTDISPGLYRMIAWQPGQLSQHRVLNLSPGTRTAIEYRQ